MNGAQCPDCLQCGRPTQRSWSFVKAPGITPQGTQPEFNRERPRLNKVDVKAIAAETKLEIESKYLRYSNEAVAEEHVRREVNHAAGICDAAGNETPLPKAPPISFDKSPAAAAP